MKFKYKGLKAEIGELGIVEPGQIFEVNNEAMIHLFTAELFEVVKNDVKKDVKKVVKKQKDGE